MKNAPFIQKYMAVKKRINVRSRCAAAAAVLITIVAAGFFSGTAETEADSSVFAAAAYETATVQETAASGEQQESWAKEKGYLVLRR